MNCFDRHPKIGRREFLQAMAVTSSVILLPNAFGAPVDGTRLKITETIGRLQTNVDKAPIAGASWFTAEAVGDGFAYGFPIGFLQRMNCLTSDVLVDGNDFLGFSIALQEGEHGRIFKLDFGGLPQCSFRVRLPMNAVDQHRWLLGREGAFLKPQCEGDRIELAKVDRATFTVLSKPPERARWCMTPLRAAADEVEKISRPILPKGKLLDDFGQSTLREWPGKTRSASDVKARILSQWDLASKQTWPEDFSRRGGWKSKKLTGGEGFFRTHNDGKRWWLVDPEGYAFWSTGLDCVSVVHSAAAYDGMQSTLAWLPDPKGEFRDIYEGVSKTEAGGNSQINYLVANLIRAFGPDGWHDKWAKITLAEMKRLRFNTVGNWSEWKYAKEAGFPYVRPLGFEAKRSGYIVRDFPDVFHPAFEADAADFASVLSDTASDPSFIGYFLMNEPSWGGSSSGLPATGMLYNTASCFTRSELCRFLKKKYSEDTQLSAKWKMPVTVAQVDSGKWEGTFTKEAEGDLREFSVVMVERYFNLISTACRKVDPNHLNLGVRYAEVPPAWAVSGMKSFDVFSMNCYAGKVPHSAFEEIHGMLKMPVMVGEYHFGALDVGLTASGLGCVKNQTDRGRAYRVYLEDAVADPYCVGAHWFQMYDQSAIGRHDGECYNIGFLDVCNRPYPELGHAAIESHERMYQVADGRAEPFSDAPQYWPRVSL